MLLANVLLFLQFHVITKMEDMNEDILKTIRGSSPDARPTDAVLSDINNAVVEKRQRDECFGTDFTDVLKFIC